MNQPTCPYCGSTKIECEFVDIGVGSIQCTPYICPDCFASQINPYDKEAKPNDTEKYTGWWRPPGVKTEYIYPPIPDRRFDWSAVMDCYDGGFIDAHGDPVGNGATELEAIQNLFSQIEEKG